MPIRLHLTSGQGPVECRMAIAHTLQRMRQEADGSGVEIDIVEERNTDKHGPHSALAIINGDGAEDFASRWTGSIQWICKSPTRPNHKRKNWFIGCQEIDPPEAAGDTIDPADVRFEAFRAGGPGGQHQNKTESAIRAIHSPTGLTVVVRENRSQHRNRAISLERLGALLEASKVVNAASDRARLQAAHAELERGNPKRTFRGEKFQEVR
ncbi:MAG: peptide chain release factor [Hyphomicrobiaceae bacterium]|jgi:peptide chain release factor